jgi:predicted nucleotidyltransferase
MEKLSLVEFADRFGRSTERREELMERLSEWVAVARAVAGLQRLWVFGSFVTGKPGPGDVDLMAVVRPRYDIREVPTDLQRYLDPEFCKAVLELDLSIFVQGSTDIYLSDLVALLGTDGAGHITAVEVEP